MVLTSSLGPKGQGGVPLRVKIRSSQTPAGLVIRGARPPIVAHPEWPPPARAALPDLFATACQRPEDVSVAGRRCSDSADDALVDVARDHPQVRRSGLPGA